MIPQAGGEKRRSKPRQGCDSVRPMEPSLAQAPPPASQDPEEAALVAALRAGDGAAYEKVVRAYGGRMLKVAQRLLKNREEARDAVQDAMVSAFKGIRSFDHGSRLYTWLHRITINTSLKRIRTLSREPEQSIEPLLPRYKDNGDRLQWARPFSEPMDLAMERAEKRAMVRQCIDRLPDTYRTVLILRDIEGLDTAETARALDATENAVKIRLHRARAALRELLEQRFTKGAP